VLGAVPGQAAGQHDAQVGAGDDVAGLVGQAFEHRHRGGRERAELAVDHHGVAADLQLVPARVEAGDGALGQVPGQRPGQGAEPGPLGLERGHAARVQRGGRDRADAGGHHGPGEGGDQRVLHAFGTGRAEHGVHGGRAGEGDRVDRAGDRLGDQAAQRRRVAVRQPPVDRDLDHLGPRSPQVGDEVGERLAVLLHRDAAAAQVLGEEILLDLFARFGGGGPVVVQPGGAHGSPGLGPAGEQAGPGQVVAQVAGQAPAFRRRHPAAEAHTCGDHHVVDGVFQALPGGGEQVGVLGERHQPDRRGAQHAGAAAFEQRAELLPSPGGGDADGETRQGVGRGLR
jgi:hypothetical protein